MLLFSNKKGFMYIIDLFVAAMIITAGLWILFFNLYYSTDYTKSRLLTDDILKGFYTKKISEINSQIILNLTDPNNIYFTENSLNYNDYGIINIDYSLVQQAVEYYYLYNKSLKNNDVQKAENYKKVLNDFLKGTFDGLIPKQYDYEITINKDLTLKLRSNKNKEQANIVLPSKTIVAGIDREEDFYGPILFEVYLWQ